MAQAVLRGKTRGYRNHPQLERFRMHRFPQKAIAFYLWSIYEESCRRGYCFDEVKILEAKSRTAIRETEGQLEYEWRLLKSRVKERSPSTYINIADIDSPRAHPIFRIVPGSVNDWEKVRK